MNALLLFGVIFVVCLSLYSYSMYDHEDFNAVLSLLGLFVSLICFILVIYSAGITRGQAEGIVRIQMSKRLSDPFVYPIKFVGVDDIVYTISPLDSIQSK